MSYQVFLQDLVLDEQWFTISPAEYVILGIGGFVNFINLLVACFIVYHRKYAPLKVRQIPLVLMALFCNLFFFCTFCFENIKIQKKIKNY